MFGGKEITKIAILWNQQDIRIFGKQPDHADLQSEIVLSTLLISFISVISGKVGVFVQRQESAQFSSAFFLHLSKSSFGSPRWPQFSVGLSVGGCLREWLFP
jgi:hypothetical protein